MCSLGMFPSLSFRRRLERRPGRRAKLGPCSFPGAVSVFSPFHIERFAWKTGKKLPLKGLLCSLLGVGREKVSLRLFKPFLLTLHPEQATAKTHPVDFRALLTCSTKSWLSAFGFPSSHTSQIGLFFVASCSPEGGRYDLKPVWGVAVWIAQPRKYSIQKRGKGTSLPPAGNSHCLCTGRIGRSVSGPLVLSALNLSGH